jgi:hypothetical protein
LAARGEAKSYDIGTEQRSGKVYERERPLQEEAEGKPGAILFCSHLDILGSIAGRYGGSG